MKMQKPKILIVDDELNHLEAIIEIIEENGNKYRVLQTFNGKIAFKIAEKEIPDLIITDWEMPEMSGIELIKQLKSHEKTKDIPIIMCTGIMITSENLATALKAGAVDYIRKPIDKIELAARINSMMKLSESFKKIKEQNIEIQNQAEELKVTNEKLKDLDQFKEEMTGMIVHDLKNPLNSIIGLAENDIVRQSGKSMMNMVTNILDVHKFEDSEIKLDINNNSIYEISKSALQKVDLLYKQKNIKLENQIQNHFVKVDYEIIERVFINILTNAIKYTPNNGTISLKSHKNSADFILIKVTDTGQGIPEDKIDTVFGKFEQIIAKKSGIARSTGIGLTFCKIFTEAHGGEISVESELNKGTTFWFSLPAGDQGNKGINIKKEETEEKSFKLSLTDKEILKPFLLQLQKLEVYESTDVEEVIKQIDFSKSQNMKNWKIEMENAIYAMNQEKYYSLLNL